MCVFCQGAAEGKAPVELTHPEVPSSVLVRQVATGAWDGSHVSGGSRGAGQRALPGEEVTPLLGVPLDSIPSQPQL